MFKSKVPEAWDRYFEDLGLGRTLFFLCLFNCFLFLYIGLVFNVYFFPSLYPIAFAALFYLFRSKIIQLSPLAIMSVGAIPITISIGYNYNLIGVIDQEIAHFERLDSYLKSFDYFLFGDLAARVIESYLRPAGAIGVFFYDMMMVSYVLYFVLPLYGAFCYYFSLPDDQKYKLGRYATSIVILFCLNFIFYIIFPVTGPQYYVNDFTYPTPPLSNFGLFFYQLVQDNHTNFIDCFPSGHTAMALMVTLWFFRINHPHRFFVSLIAVLIMMATLAMRYHYVLDLVAAIPLVFVSYFIGKIVIPSKSQVIYHRKNTLGWS